MPFLTSSLFTHTHEQLILDMVLSISSKWLVAPTYLSISRAVQNAHMEPIRFLTINYYTNCVPSCLSSRVVSPYISSN